MTRVNFYNLSASEKWTLLFIILFTICLIWLYKSNAFDRVRDVIRALRKKTVDKDSAEMQTILSKVYCTSCGKTGASFLRYGEQRGRRVVIGKCNHCGKKVDSRY